MQTFVEDQEVEGIRSQRGKEEKMIQIRSRLIPADNSGAKSLKVIGIPGSNKRRATLGDVIVASVDRADPTGAVKDSELVRVVIVRTKKECRRKDGSYVRFDDNAGVVVY